LTNKIAASDLKHLETFTNPFVKVIVCCKICDKPQSLKFQASWKRHYLTHASAEEKPFKCRYCERAFVQANALTLHIKGRHSLHKSKTEKAELKNEYM